VKQKEDDKTADMLNHESLVEVAKEAINAVFSDTSVSNSQTRESLLELIEEINSALEAMDVDGSFDD
jgi:hypothetical protein